MQKGDRIFWLSLMLLTCEWLAATSSGYVYRSRNQSFRYTVSPTGENYTFKFEQSPGDTAEKLAAGYQVLRQIYQDDSIKPKYTEHYIRERARCYLYDSRFHTYSLCFLPNDFNPDEKSRFWGFVTQIPNWKWLATRFFLPATLIFAGFFYFGNSKSNG